MKCQWLLILECNPFNFLNIGYSPLPTCHGATATPTPSNVSRSDFDRPSNMLWVHCPIPFQAYQGLTANTSNSSMINCEHTLPICQLSTTSPSNMSRSNCNPISSIPRIYSNIFQCVNDPFLHFNDQLQASPANMSGQLRRPSSVSRTKSDIPSSMSMLNCDHPLPACAGLTSTLPSMSMSNFNRSRTPFDHIIEQLDSAF